MIRARSPSEQLAKRRRASAPAPTSSSAARARSRCVGGQLLGQQDRARQAGEHDVDRPLFGVEPAAERGLDEPDPPPQLVQRHPAEPASEHPRRPLARPHLRRGDPQERRLPRPVRPDDPPVLARLGRPVDPVEDGLPHPLRRAPEADLLETNRLAQGPRTLANNPGRTGPLPPCPKSAKPGPVPWTWPDEAWLLRARRFRSRPVERLEARRPAPAVGPDPAWSRDLCIDRRFGGAFVTPCLQLGRRGTGCGGVLSAWPAWTVAKSPSGELSFSMNHGVRSLARDRGSASGGARRGSPRGILSAGGRAARLRPVGDQRADRRTRADHRTTAGRALARRRARGADRGRRGRPRARTRDPREARGRRSRRRNAGRRKRIAASRRDHRVGRDPRLAGAPPTLRRRLARGPDQADRGFGIRSRPLPGSRARSARALLRRASRTPGPLRDDRAAHRSLRARRPAGLALARGRLALLDLGGVPLVGHPSCRGLARVEAQLRARGVEPEFAFRSTVNATIQALAGAGVGAAVLPALGVDPANETT